MAEEKGQRVDYYSLHENTMEYAIRCMAYFEKMASWVYDKLTERSSAVAITEVINADFIREFFKRYPEMSQNAFA